MPRWWISSSGKKRNKGCLCQVYNDLIWYAGSNFIDSNKNYSPKSASSQSFLPTQYRFDGSKKSCSNCMFLVSSDCRHMPDDAGWQQQNTSSQPSRNSLVATDVRWCAVFSQPPFAVVDGTPIWGDVSLETQRWQSTGSHILVDLSCLPAHG